MKVTNEYLRALIKEGLKVKINKNLEEQPRPGGTGRGLERDDEVATAAPAPAPNVNTSAYNSLASSLGSSPLGVSNQLKFSPADVATDVAPGYQVEPESPFADSQGRTPVYLKGRGGGTKPTGGTKPAPKKLDPVGVECTKSVQRYLKQFQFNLGNTGPNRDGIDGVYGTLTKQAVQMLLTKKGINTIPTRPCEVARMLGVMPDTTNPPNVTNTPPPNATNTPPVDNGDGDPNLPAGKNIKWYMDGQMVDAVVGNDKAIYLVVNGKATKVVIGFPANSLTFKDGTLTHPTYGEVVDDLITDYESLNGLLNIPTTVGLESFELYDQNGNSIGDLGDKFINYVNAQRKLIGQKSLRGLFGTSIPAPNWGWGVLTDDTPQSAPASTAPAGGPTAMKAGLPENIFKGKNKMSNTVRLSSSYLKQIIQEELESFLNEQTPRFARQGGINPEINSTPPEEQIPPEEMYAQIGYGYDKFAQQPVELDANAEKPYPFDPSVAKGDLPIAPIEQTIPSVGRQQAKKSVRRSDPDVKALQQTMVAAGVMTPQQNINGKMFDSRDGVFGQQTRSGYTRLLRMGLNHLKGMVGSYQMEGNQQAITELTPFINGINKELQSVTTNNKPQNMKNALGIAQQLIDLTGINPQTVKNIEGILNQDVAAQPDYAGSLNIPGKRKLNYDPTTIKGKRQNSQPPAIANLPENKVVFSKQYLQKIIAEEARKVLKKKN